MAYKWGKEYKSDYELAAENILLARTAQNCLEDTVQLPPARKLFGSFWHEGELAALIGDRLTGKSTLAVQIGDAISKGLSIEGIIKEGEKQKVLYFDFDKGDKVFESQFARSGTTGYVFDSNFIRVVLRPDYSHPENMGSILFTAIENIITEHEAKVVIVDSLTGISHLNFRYPHRLHRLFLRLKQLQNKHNLSMLVVADTERDNRGLALSVKRMEEGYNIFATVASVFAMGMCTSEYKVRYLLQLKCTAAVPEYTALGALVCQLATTGFEFVGHCAERHLLQSPLTQVEEVITQIHEADPNLSLGDIAQKAGTYKMKVKRTLDLLKGLNRLKATLGT